jgi:hypothetical protein
MRGPEKTGVGWREWVSLPLLGVDSVKVKVDTGARSSSLHAYDIEEITLRGKPWVVFKVHPLQRNDSFIQECRAPLLEHRHVTSSNGKRDLRPVIHTQVRLGVHELPIELTLTRRDEMGFRMLLGREALRGRFVVDPGRSYIASKRPPRERRRP